MTSLHRAWAALALAAATAAQAPAVPLPKAGFQKVLWLDAAAAQDPAFLQRVRAAGFDGINLGPGLDPAPVRAAGLGFYLDQPAGKGLLELRDADYEPLRAAYERDRDPAAMLRPVCLLDPVAVPAACARAATAAAAVRGKGLLFVALADEASATRHNNPLDLCRCSRCLAAFAAFLRTRHASLDALNGAWATQFADWQDVTPLSTDQVRRRELGSLSLPANLQPFAEWLEFVDARFAAVVQTMTAQVQREVDGVPVGLTGLQPPTAFGGHDYCQLLPPLTLIEPYDVGAAPELARSLLPQAECWFTHTLPTAPAAVGGVQQQLLLARLCAAAASGNRGVVVWNAASMFADGGAVSAAGKELLAALQRMRTALDACAGATLQPADLWIVESPSSVRAWWMLDSADDGMTWVRRLASHEATHSTSFASRRSWTKLLGDLGLQPQFVGERELPERLLRERPRALVLAATVALADRACQAITAYAKAGGTVLADHGVALYDQNLVLRQAGGLDPLFGITARSRQWSDLNVREGRRRDAAIEVAETGLRGELAESRGREQVFVERRHGRGRAVCLNLPVCDYDGIRLDPAAAERAQDLRRRVRQVLQSAGVEPVCDVRGEALPTCLHRSVLRLRDGRRLLVVRVDAQDRPALLRELAQQPQRPVRVEFPRPVRLSSLAGGDLGERAMFELSLDVLEGLFLVAGRQ